jgi:putative heme iron utilization protein
MTLEDKRLLLALLERRVTAMGVLVDGVPYVGLLPFAPSHDRRSLYVHASGLARHARGLGDGMPFSALVHEPEDTAPDSLQVPRATFQGTVERLDPTSVEHAAARAAYLERFPEGATTFELADFGLYALRIAEGRLVAGFARARNVSPGDLATLTE